MDEIDRLVDAALDSYPMAPTPPGFTDRVMAKITLQPKVAFHLDFLDLALPAFFTLFGASLVGVPLLLLAMIDPIKLELLGLQARIALARLSLTLPLLRVPGPALSVQPWLMYAVLYGVLLAVLLLLAALGAIPVLVKRRKARSL